MTHGEVKALREAFEALNRLTHGMVETGAACDDPEGFVLACNTQDCLGELLFHLEGNEEPERPSHVYCDPRTCEDMGTDLALLTLGNIITRTTLLDFALPELRDRSIDNLVAYLAANLDR